MGGRYFISESHLLVVGYFSKPTMLVIEFKSVDINKDKRSPSPVLNRLKLQGMRIVH